MGAASCHATSSTSFGARRPSDPPTPDLQRTHQPGPLHSQHHHDKGQPVAGDVTSTRPLSDHTRLLTSGSIPRTLDCVVGAHRAPHRTARELAIGAVRRESGTAECCVRVGSAAMGEPGRLVVVGSLLAVTGAAGGVPPGSGLDGFSSMAAVRLGNRLSIPGGTNAWPPLQR